MPAARIEEAAEWWGTVGDRDDAARPRHRAADQGRRQRARGHQPRPRHRQVRQARVRRVDHHRPGQRPGRARARPQVRPAPRQPRHHQPRAPRRTSPRSGAATSPRSRARASPPRRSSRPSTTAPSRACCRSASTRPCRHPTPTSPREALDKLEFYAVIDFFLSESAQHADVVLARVAARGGRGHLDQRRGPHHQDQRGGRPRPARPAATGRSSSRSPSASARASTSATQNTEEIFEELCRASAGGTADYTGATWERIVAEHGPVLAGPRGRPPGHAPPATRAGGSPTPTARPASTPCRSASPPRSSTTSTRSGSPPAGSSASTCRAPRPGASPAWSSSTPSRSARSTRKLAEPLGIADGDLVTVTLPARRDDPAGHTWSTPSGPTPCSSRTTGPATKAANQLTNRAVDPLSKMPEFKVAAVRVDGRRPAAPPTPATSSCHEPA